MRVSVEDRTLLPGCTAATPLPRVIVTLHSPPTRPAGRIVLSGRVATGQCRPVDQDAVGLDPDGIGGDARILSLGRAGG